MLYGNKQKSGLKISQWNAGHGFLINKQDEICQIVEEQRPDIFGITESSFFNSHSLNDVTIKDYSIFFASTLDNPQLDVSRVSVYVHKDVIVKTRLDLMNDTFSSVWLELGKPRQKKILLCVASLKVKCGRCILIYHLG